MKRTVQIVALGIIACGAKAAPPVMPTWMSLGPADVPARVSAVQFGDGTTMDGNNPHRWGVWQGVLTSDATITHWTPAHVEADLVCTDLMVGPAECSNTSTGDASACWIKMIACTNGAMECFVCGDDQTGCMSDFDLSYVGRGVQPHCPASVSTQ